MIYVIKGVVMMLIGKYVSESGDIMEFHMETENQETDKNSWEINHFKETHPDSEDE
jgi:hypothetical protein